VLALTIVILAGVSVAGELALPTAGPGGFAARALALAAIPVLLVLARVVTVRQVADLWASVRSS
jgi:hypothetical protein